MRRVIAAAIVGSALFLGACSGESKPDVVEQQQAAKAQSVAQIRANQPVQPMSYSPTLQTINDWAKTWGKKNKVSYVYMQRADGEYAGYYVLKGLPVSYCVGGSPPYDVRGFHQAGGGTTDSPVPAPGLDGAYYGGCNANRYYGFDAVTGQYIEYTDGYVLTAVLSDSPLPLDKQPHPFVSSIEDVKKAGK